MGLERVFVGMENGVDTVLRRYRKSSRLADNVVAAERLKSAGIPAQWGFIMLTPDSTIDEVRANIDFLVQSGQAHFAKHYCNVLKVYPGTRFFSEFEEQGLILVERAYLPLQYRYKDFVIGELAAMLGRLSGVGYHLDRLLWDIEFGVASRREVITTEYGAIPRNSAARAFLESLQAKRAHSWSVTLKTFLKSGRASSFARVEAMLREHEARTRNWADEEISKLRLSST
jgi:hypothetical protein